MRSLIRQMNASVLECFSDIHACQHLQQRQRSCCDALTADTQVNVTNIDLRLSFTHFPPVAFARGVLQGFWRKCFHDNKGILMFVGTNFFILPRATFYHDAGQIYILYIFVYLQKQIEQIKIEPTAGWTSGIQDNSNKGKTTGCVQNRALFTAQVRFYELPGNDYYSLDTSLKIWKMF